MKIQVDGQDVFELDETQKKVIQNEIMSEIFDDDMKRRARWVIEHKYDQCFERLKREWEPKLRERVPAVPTDKNAFAELIFSQPDYKSASVKEQEKRAAL